ncbi:MAG: hypothetical protein PPHEINF_5836 [uncultured Paraburkholderia sp.]|nr:MAG: hypothetical protein PPHEINF_5836 [uncultured Paraburkholderia sp.]CAH2807480.1 MAG: hypothetical protein PPHEESC_5827 [uncultured Paraburkholderia sp.]CAH2942812.1 MAG: hypothetical protein PPHEMADMSA_5852 [uncultured Paraburkholderia sp.]CAH2943846.1 MAG: hypothetical protein PPHERAN_5877 [uncultured Paraburkholderia sp.]
MNSGCIFIQYPAQFKLYFKFVASGHVMAPLNGASIPIFMPQRLIRLSLPLLRIKK